MNKIEILNRIDPLFLNGVAHRGLHDDTYTENGLGAFENAINNNVAFEFDVHLSLDKKLIVCHDSNLKRTCNNKEGVIEELTLDEIKRNYRLNNGEEVPTLDEVLELNDERVPMVIELKPYTKTKNYKELAQKLKERLDSISDKKKVILISFYPQCLTPFKGTGFIRALLVGKERKIVYALRHKFEGVDLEWTLLRSKKFQKAKKKMLVMARTIEKEEQLSEISNFIDSATFQYLDPSIVRRYK